MADETTSSDIAACVQAVRAFCTTVRSLSLTQCSVCREHLVQNRACVRMARIEHVPHVRMTWRHDGDVAAGAHGDVVAPRDQVQHHVVMGLEHAAPDRRSTSGSTSGSPAPSDRVDRWTNPHDTAGPIVTVRDHLGHRAPFVDSFRIIRYDRKRVTIRVCILGFQTSPGAGSPTATR